MRIFLILCSCFFMLPVYGEPVTNPDPWEKTNRKIYNFNVKLDKYLLKPVAQGYKKVTPDSLEKGISNFFSNLGGVPTIANDLAQLKFKKAGKDTGRFLLNSTVGLLGFFDVAKDMWMPHQKEDFGQTLGFWGVSSGPYVMLPLLGPSTIRDGAGLAVDSYLSPYASLDDDVKLGLLSANTISLRAGLLKKEELLEGQGDPYTFLRGAYLQGRELAVTDGRSGLVDEFGEEDF